MGGENALHSVTSVHRNGFGEIESREGKGREEAGRSASSVHINKVQLKTVRAAARAVISLVGSNTRPPLRCKVVPLS